MKQVDDAHRRNAFQEEIFLKEYRVNGNNAYKAAIAAGYSESRSLKACMWIRYTREKSEKPELWDAFHAARKKVLSHLDVTYERIMTEYARLAFWNPRDWLDDTGKLKRLIDMDEDAQRAFGAEVKDKQRALDSLSRVMGMNNDKVTVDMKFEDLLIEIVEKSAVEPLVLDDQSYQIEDAQ